MRTRSRSRSLPFLLVNLALGLLGAVMLLAGPARAGDGESWDDSGMRTRHEPVEAPGDAPGPVLGETRFDELRRGATAAAPPIRTPKVLEHVSQRAWEARTGGPSLDVSRFSAGSAPRVGRIDRQTNTGSRRGSAGQSSRSGRVN